MRKRERRNLKNRVRRETVYVNKTYPEYDTITNTPVDPKTGILNFHRQKTEERKRVVKGHYSLWRALLEDAKGRAFVL